MSNAVNVNPQTNLRGASRRGRQLVKFVTRTAGASLLLVLLLLAGLNIRQFLLRKRIENVARVARELQLKHASQGEIQRRLIAVNKNTRTSCRDNHCTYEMAIASPNSPDSFIGRIFLFIEEEWWPGLLGSVGLHPFLFRLTMTTGDGIYESTDIGIMMGYRPLLDAGISDRCLNPKWDVGPTRSEQHPGWHVKLPVLTTPGGGFAATVCLTTQAKPKELQAAWHINFSCLTRWGNCDQMEEFFPAIGDLEKSAN